MSYVSVYLLMSDSSADPVFLHVFCVILMLFDIIARCQSSSAVSPDDFDFKDLQVQFRQVNPILITNAKFSIGDVRVAASAVGPCSIMGY